MKKLFFISAMLIGATSLVAFTPNDSKELEYNDLTETYSSIEMMGLYGTVNDSYNQARTADKSEWKKYHHVIIIEPESNIAMVESIIDRN